MSTLKGKVAVVTGGSRGIGRAIVSKIASAGCDVAFSYLRDENSANDLVDECTNKGVKCKAYAVDVKDLKKVKAWVDEVKNEFARLDILINNAGIINDKPLMLMNEEDWKEVIDTNLYGTINASKAVIVTFMKQRSGLIVNISSVTGIIGKAGQTNYAASKGGINAFTKALAKEVAQRDVRVNAVAPGFIETDILKDFSEEQLLEIKDTIPMKRLGQAEEVANCVEFLLSEDAQYITGQIIQVDGGLVIK